MPSEFAPDPIELERILSDVAIEREIARGGQKIVFRGRSATFGDLAVKLYKPGSAEALERAQRELLAASSITDGRFPRVFHSRTIVLAGEQILCVYEQFFHGQSLREAARVNDFETGAHGI